MFYRLKVLILCQRFCTVLLLTCRCRLVIISMYKEKFFLQYLSTEDNNIESDEIRKLSNTFLILSLCSHLGLIELHLTHRLKVML